MYAHFRFVLCFFTFLLMCMRLVSVRKVILHFLSCPHPSFCSMRAPRTLRLNALAPSLCMHCELYVPDLSLPASSLLISCKNKEHVSAFSWYYVCCLFFAFLLPCFHPLAPLLRIGDVLRLLDNMDVITGDFILLSGDVLCTKKFTQVIKEHKCVFCFSQPFTLSFPIFLQPLLFRLFLASSRSVSLCLYGLPSIVKRAASMHSLTSHPLPDPSSLSRTLRLNALAYRLECIASYMSQIGITNSACLLPLPAPYTRVFMCVSVCANFFFWCCLDFHMCVSVCVVHVVLYMCVLCVERKWLRVNTS